MKQTLATVLLELLSKSEDIDIFADATEDSQMWDLIYYDDGKFKGITLTDYVFDCETYDQIDENNSQDYTFYISSYGYKKMTYKELKEAHERDLF